MHDPFAVTTFLFTDIEGSTRLWEQAPERMRPALGRHDALSRTAVESHNGTVVKSTGDGIYAAFADAVDALGATFQLQQALADPEATCGVALRVRCGLHAGVVERRDNDFFGDAVNRTARIMGAAHGGQVIVSQAVVDLVGDRLPPPLSLRDLGAVRLKDLARPERVYQMLHPQLRRDFPALRSLEATPNNLPQQITSFVGRERALAEVRALLADARLLTLVGVGGLGKTRLSLQVGAAVLDDYPDGVWFVELAALADPRLVAQAVASVLGVKEDAGRPVQEALLKFVKDRHLLLLLDNCEHLAQACAELARELLQSGSQVKVLASSRESLHVVGETTYSLSTLAVPDPRQAWQVAALTQNESVQLFRTRALGAQPAFCITGENATAVAEICHRLDGIPLALELAAARTRALSIETIAERLSDRFHLLTGGDATSLPRQQTLRACIDWSYDLLSEAERTLLRRLAVFAGGWTLSAAEAVGAGGDVETSSVLDLLTKLVEKSLVEFDADAGRYGLLETVRHYAQERLAASGEGDQSRTRHLAFYMALADNATPRLVGADQGVWLSWLDLEHENLLSTHNWCDRAEGGAALGLRLILAMQPYWLTRGMLALAYRATVESLSRGMTEEHAHDRCRVVLSAGQLAYFMGRYAEAVKYGEDGLVIALSNGDRRRVAGAHAMLGTAYLAQNEQTAARGHLDEALAMARASGENHVLAIALNALAELHRAQGDLEAAEHRYVEALALDRARGDRSAVAVNLVNLAHVAIARNSGVRACEMAGEALAIAEDLGSRRIGVVGLDVCAGIAALLAEWARAARLFGAARAQEEQTGIRRDPADEAYLTPLIAKAREALGEAAFARAEAGGRLLGYEDALKEARASVDCRS